MSTYVTKKPAYPFTRSYHKRVNKYTDSLRGLYKRDTVTARPSKSLGDTCRDLCRGSQGVSRRRARLTPSAMVAALPVRQDSLRRFAPYPRRFGTAALRARALYVVQILAPAVPLSGLDCLSEPLETATSAGAAVTMMSQRFLQTSSIRTNTNGQYHHQ